MLKRVFFLAFVLFPAIAFAQDGGGAVPAVNWNEVIGYAVNTAFVFTALQLIKSYAPNLSKPVKQILALAGGPLLMMFAQPALSAALGYEIDFSPLANALSGLASSFTAMAAYEHASIASGQKR